MSQISNQLQMHRHFLGTLFIQIDTKPMKNQFFSQRSNYNSIQWAPEIPLFSTHSAVSVRQPVYLWYLVICCCTLGYLLPTAHIEIRLSKALRIRYQRNDLTRFPVVQRCATSAIEFLSASDNQCLYTQYSTHCLIWSSTEVGQKIWCYLARFLSQSKSRSADKAHRSFGQARPISMCLVPRHQQVHRKENTCTLGGSIKGRTKKQQRGTVPVSILVTADGHLFSQPMGMR